MDGGWTRGRHIQSPRHGHARARHRRVAAVVAGCASRRLGDSATGKPRTHHRRARAREPPSAPRRTTTGRPARSRSMPGRRAHGLCPAVPVCLRPAVLKRKRTLIGSSGHGTAWYGRHGAGRAAEEYERMEAQEGFNWIFFQISIKFLI